MKRFFTNGFWQKAVWALLLLFQFLLLIALVIYLSSNLLAQSLPVIILILLLYFVVDIIVLLYIVNSTSPTVYKMTWMVVVVAIPVGGLLIYAIFANKQTSRRNRKKYLRYAAPITRKPSSKEEKANLLEFSETIYPLSEYIEKASGGGACQQTSVEYFPTVEGAFPFILEELEKAKHYIFVEYFIIEPGKFFTPILEILKRKVAEGVDVRLMYDDVGSMKTVPAHYYKTLQSFGIQAHVFHPFRGVMDVRVNNRDHRKLLIIDGHTCFTGGFNLADEYINAVVKFGHWKDNGVMIKGKGVTNFTDLFLSNWIASFITKEGFDRQYYDSSTYIEEIGGYPENDGYVQGYGDIPYENESIGENVYLRLIHAAKHSLSITTPYLIIDEEMQNALCSAAKSGVKVDIITPHIPDKKAVFNVTRSFYGPLIKAGICIHEYTPGFIHEKMVIADDDAAAIGTINMDYRSLYLHMENGCLLIGNSQIKRMKEDFLMTKKASHEVNYQEWERWHKRNLTYWALLRILAPFL